MNKLEIKFKSQFRVPKAYIRVGHISVVFVETGTGTRPVKELISG